MNNKLHAICDSQGRQLDHFVTAGQVSDYIAARALLSSMPDVGWLIGDRGYDADWFLEALKDARGDFLAKRLDARRARLVTQRTFEALLHKGLGLLPAPDADLRLICLAHDLHSAHAIGGEQNNTGAPDVLLWRVTIFDKGQKTSAISRSNSDGNSSAHAPDLHITGPTGIHRGIQMSDLIH